MSNMISDAFLAELEHESALTRRTLERVPEGKGEFKPHPKSMSLAQLSGHLAEIPGWGTAILNEDVFNLDPTQVKPSPPKSAREAVRLFDDGMAALRGALLGKSDAHMTATWKMTVQGKPKLEMPRVAVFRNFVMNHAIHHRAQLGVYLRLNGAAVPSTYGPSADEPAG